MFTIIPAKEATAENLKSLQTNGRDKLLYIENLKQSTLFQNLIQNALLIFLHQMLPGSISLNIKDAFIPIRPYDYGIPAVGLDPNGKLLYQAIVDALNAELNRHGYKVSYQYGSFKVTWE